MPQMDGLTLARMIRRDAHHANTPMIMISSAGQPGDAQRSREIGVARYLMKPVMTRSLLAAIREALSGVSLAVRPVKTEARAATVRPLRILLAEDNPVNRKVAIGLLEKHGHTVVVVEDGRMALDAIDRLSFDLVLMDVQMPEIDGFEATRMIREREATTGHRLPIIALTARAIKGDREKCLDAGMDAYIAKPIRTAELLQAIELVMPAITPVQDDEATLGPDGAPLDTAGERPAFDRQLALEYTDGSEELLAQVIQIYLTEGPVRRDELWSGLEREDRQVVERAAHRLKGALGTLGATIASDMAQRIEVLAKDGDLALASGAFTYLDAEMTRLHRELEAESERRAA
jgi:CheY-like chemotaxis protein/HPt (histidine-containing phosphotransfer) domain-containing protein